MIRKCIDDLSDISSKQKHSVTSPRNSKSLFIMCTLVVTIFCRRTPIPCRCTLRRYVVNGSSVEVRERSTEAAETTRRRANADAHATPRLSSFISRYELLSSGTHVSTASASAGGSSSSPAEGFLITRPKTSSNRLRSVTRPAAARAGYRKPSASSTDRTDMPVNGCVKFFLRKRRLHDLVIQAMQTTTNTLLSLRREEAPFPGHNVTRDWRLDPNPWPQRDQGKERSSPGSPCDQRYETSHRPRVNNVTRDQRLTPIPGHKVTGERSAPNRVNF